MNVNHIINNNEVFCGILKWLLDKEHMDALVTIVNYSRRVFINRSPPGFSRPVTYWCLVKRDIASLSSQNIGYVIPVPIIEHFLGDTDPQDGKHSRKDHVGIAIINHTPNHQWVVKTIKMGGLLLLYPH